MTKKKLPLIFHYIKNDFDPPAPVLEISLSSPVSQGEAIKIPALLDSGADITVIPQDIVYKLQLKYVDRLPTSGYDGSSKDSCVYSVKIAIENLGNYIIKVIALERDNVLVGRDMLNKWSILLKGREEIFEIF